MAQELRFHERPSSSGDWRDRRTHCDAPACAWRTV